jgi:hypothetical protein
MKKLFSVMTAVCLSMVMMAATTFTFTDSPDPQSQDGFTVTLAKGTGSTAPAAYDNGVRLYASNTITVTGESITRIDIVCVKQGKKDYATLTADGGELVTGGTSASADDPKVDVWTGSASSVVFTLGASGQRVIKQVVINGDGTTPTPTPGPDPTPTPDPQLDSTYVYAEPTTIGVPAAASANPYTFVDNNIMVSCSRGAIYESYFACYAGESITFNATQNIKGIAINGMVKKGFTATVDNGTIGYLDASEADTESNPVLWITDVDAMSVTIACVKQLRCYSVDVYFEANPDVMDTVSFVVNTAEAEYYEQYSTEGAYNYMLYLYDSITGAPEIGIDLYAAAEGVLGGYYSFADQTMDDYSYVYVSDEESVYADDGQLLISQAGDQYSIAGSLTCGTKVYNFVYTGPVAFTVYDPYSYEEEGGKSYSIACTWQEATDYTAEYNDVYLYMGDNDNQILLDVYVSALDAETVIPVGTYTIDNSAVASTVLASDGEGMFGTNPSYMMGAFEYDEESGDYVATKVWYIVSGTLTVTKTNKGARLELVAQTGHGSTINAVYEGPVTSALNNVIAPLDKNAPMYDVLGRQVEATYQGIVIQNGKRYLNR